MIQPPVAPAALPASARARSALCALWSLAWLAGLVGLLGTAFILASSLAAARGASAALRSVAGSILVLGLPLLLRALLRRRAGRRGRPLPHLGGWFIGGWNLVLAAILCCALANATGRALTAHGDWILGATDGWLPRRYRPAVRAVGAWIERNLGRRGPSDAARDGGAPGARGASRPPAAAGAAAEVRERSSRSRDPARRRRSARRS